MQLTPEQIAHCQARYPDRTIPRSCGSCYACCYLGVSELQKHTGDRCPHLVNNGNKCCSIYSNRPTACRTFRCAWIEGLAADTMRPDRSGVLVCAYAPRTDVSHISVTIHVINPHKAGTIYSGRLRTILEELVALGANDITVVNLKTKDVTHIAPDGMIRRGRLHDQAPNDYEGLNFEYYDPPIGRYHVL